MTWNWFKRREAVEDNPHQDPPQPPKLSTREILENLAARQAEQSPPKTETEVAAPEPPARSVVADFIVDELEQGPTPEPEPVSPQVLEHAKFKRKKIAKAFKPPTNPVPKKTEDLSAVMEILKAVRRLEGKGLSREQIIVLTADEMFQGRTWKIKKSQVREVFYQIIKVSEGIE